VVEAPSDNHKVVIDELSKGIVEAKLKILSRLVGKFLEALKNHSTYIEELNNIDKVCAL